MLPHIHPVCLEVTVLQALSGVHLIPGEVLAPGEGELPNPGEGEPLDPGDGELPNPGDGDPACTPTPIRKWW